MTVEAVAHKQERASRHEEAKSTAFDERLDSPHKKSRICPPVGGRNRRVRPGYHAGLGILFQTNAGHVAAFETGICLRRSKLAENGSERVCHGSGAII